MSEILRRLLLALLFVAMLGTGVELLLLEHTESVWQWVPVALLAAGLLTTTALALRPGSIVVRVHQVVMALCALSGPVGIQRHYAGNVEFEREMYPTLGGLDLVREALQGATPALAPGTMLYLGLLGLAVTFRHPAHAGKPPGQPA